MGAASPCHYLGIEVEDALDLAQQIEITEV